MEYNWAEIFKNKSTKELYEIYLGKTLLGSETKKFAKKELERRNFDFNDLSKQKKKLELESLIEQLKSENSFFFKTQSAFEYLLLGIIGLVLFVSSIILLFTDSLRESVNNLNKNSNLQMLAFGFIFSIFGFIMFKYKKGRDRKIQNRINELINEL